MYKHGFEHGWIYITGSELEIDGFIDGLLGFWIKNLLLEGLDFTLRIIYANFQKNWVIFQSPI